MKFIFSKRAVHLGLYIKTGQGAEKDSHLGGLKWDRGLYIKMDLFPTITALLGLPVLLDVLAILLQIIGVLLKPFLEAGVIVLAAVGIIPSPAPIILGLASFLTGGLSAGLLPFADSGVGAEGLITVGAFSAFHPGPLSGLESQEPNKS